MRWSSLFILVFALAACTGSSDSSKPSDDSQPTDTDTTPTGCAAWASWECTPSAGGCGATCGDASILCNGGDSCRLDDGQSCAGMTGEGCDLCEQAVVECGAEWGL